jgi:C1A family cysteine protease
MGRISSILPSPADGRDHRYQSRKLTLERRVDLRDWASLVEDQGSLGSCTGQALTAAYELLTRIQYPESVVKLSDLYVYYNARFFYSETFVDNGAYLRDILKATKKYGICRDDLWPYDVTRYDQQPTPACYEDAVRRTITEYETIITQEEMLEVVNAGRPVVIGINLYDDFSYLTQEDAVVPMPSDQSQFTGMHAMAIVGYDLDRRLWLAQNSYGTSWGDMGYCWIPFEYMEKEVIERWCFDISDPRLTLLS